MRPKKKILLIDENEARFAVCCASSAAEAITASADFEVALLAWPLSGGSELLRKLRSQHPFTRTLALAEDAKGCPTVSADVVLWGHPSTFELLERINVLAARKRGPRKAQAIEHMLALAERRVA
jgi:DNA-binding response OmpR family regulator